jgi:hypothetical protein
MFDMEGKRCRVMYSAEQIAARVASSASRSRRTTRTSVATSCWWAS